MNLNNFFLKKKFHLICIFFTVYFLTNLIGGDRGMLAYIEKKNHLHKLVQDKKNLKLDIEDLEKKNSLLSEKLDLDYIDILYREKLNFGKKDEILIKLK